MLAAQLLRRWFVQYNKLQDTMDWSQAVLELTVMQGGGLFSGLEDSYMDPVQMARTLYYLAVYSGLNLADKGLTPRLLHK